MPPPPSPHRRCDPRAVTAVPNPCGPVGRVPHSHTHLALPGTSQSHPAAAALNSNQNNKTRLRTRETQVEQCGETGGFFLSFFGAESRGRGPGERGPGPSRPRRCGFIPALTCGRSQWSSGLLPARPAPRSQNLPNGPKTRRTPPPLVLLRNPALN